MHKGYTVQHRELQSLFCINNNFQWIIIYINTESLCYIHETNIILLINYSSIKEQKTNKRST